MAVRTWPGSTPDVMPAFARGHLGEADGCVSSPSSPSPSTAGSLPNPPWGGDTWSLTCLLHAIIAFMEKKKSGTENYAKGTKCRQLNFELSADSLW